ncbi:MAG: hypothetical protein R3C61_00285 [Bacteroidia bacterium]
MSRPLNITVSEKLEYTGHTGSVYAMTTSSDERWLFTAGDDGIVAKWDLYAGDDQGTGVMRTDRSVYSLLYLPGDRLMAGTSDGTLYVCDLSSREILVKTNKSSAAIYNLWFDPGAGVIWCLQAKGGLTLYQSEDMREITHRQISDNNLRCVCESPEGTHMFVGASDNRIYVLEKNDASVAHSWEAHKNSVFALAVVPESGLLISGGMDAYLNVWDVKNQIKLIKSLPAHNFTVNDIVFSPDGKYFATASRDKSIKLWNSVTFDLLKVVSFEKNMAHRHSINRVKWLNADQSLISCSDDRRVIRWNVLLN